MNTQKPDPNKFADLVMLQLAHIRAELTYVQYEAIEIKMMRKPTKGKLLQQRKKWESKTKALAGVLHSEFRELVGLR